jgi:hypothetical protein
MLRSPVKNPAWAPKCVIVAVTCVALVAVPKAVAQAAAQSVSSVRVGLPPDFYRTFRHGFAEANGVRLHYVVGGPAEGDLVVLLHGWPQTRSPWLAAISE